MNDMQFMNLFPTTIFMKETTTVNNEELTKYLYQLEREDNKPIIKSNVGGYQSKHNLYEDVETKELCEFIIDTINNDILDDKWYKNKKSTQDNISNMWGNINRYGNLNVNHNHPRAWLSGAYYIKTPTNEDFGNLCFLDPIETRIYSLD